MSDIRFADLSNGWVFGNTLWATHTGGAAWHQLTFGGSLLGVDQLEPGANGYVYGVFETLYRSLHGHRLRSSPHAVARHQ